MGDVAARDLARWRLHTQRLSGAPAEGPVEVVSHLLAVQAENPSQAAWAVAARCAPITEAELGAIFDRGDILRTHVLRPTWHFVLPDDIVWLTSVTAPRVRKAHAQNQRDTHALVADRAPTARRLDRDAALAELARRYITGHGPATERDLAYWESLSLGDARAGLRAVSGELSTFVSDDRTYWYVHDTEPASLDAGSAHLLQILDEIYRGYQDSRWALDADERLSRRREPSAGMALLDGQVAATMTRRIADTVTFELRLYRPITRIEDEALAAVTHRYGEFLERPARLAIQP